MGLRKYFDDAYTSSRVGQALDLLIPDYDIGGGRGGGSAKRFASDFYLPNRQKKKTFDYRCEIDEPIGAKVIFLMGMTGTGKSSFIKLLTENRDIKIGGGIDPETSEIQSFSFYHKHQYVVMVDTPGFDDNRPNMSDSRLLEDITNFLIKKHKGKTLHGLIYFHRISDVRISGTAKRNIRMMSSLCGPSAMKNVAIVTTRWDEVHKEQLQAAEKTETQLSGYFKDFTDNGAQLYRHYNTLESAKKLISSVLDFTAIDKIQIVEEIRSRKTLFQTAAGRELASQLAQLEADHVQHIEGLVKQLEAASGLEDNSYYDELNKLRNDLRERRGKVAKDRQKLELTQLAPTPLWRSTWLSSLLAWDN
ncbi:uncharacterized protein LACBIDRAFT_298188 [Laccaria bicolor S238N-H82]|uniref:Predicted protein n=1 Tax=Laccaria bicolor (strain S238N-H82 / ATCC MYA-4686) TaxID=486041 RepID=B0DCE7_LACBS|nr:uncharacterized protein LACBIDRAFT_298182 [Laccaria bicolor S238N-H82]XP_001881676.1 uncharacterized protein LACBIDRAFT_298188 [Laccaria bicolor S238N-H82]EDR07885.1 predicted protein [Laccaria bicolor S238N-H82]EDR07887.1 predicted protein [Laccaria bicolor S238N-H82]|eukprot:XP_001881674.1 predicted protein [Laccaria bicolor S238N-H82]